MATIGFVGLGNMGRPMAENLLKAGHAVRGFDLFPAAREAFAAAAGQVGTSIAESAAGSEVVITMLPAGPQVREAYGEILAYAPAGALLIDCSTIDVATARAVAADAAAGGFDMLDAPVSGGTVGAAAATLTFMVGGTTAAVGRAQPFLQAMGRTVVHCGDSGTGQAAKICNNMILGITMGAVSEAFVLAERLGLDAQKLFDVSAKSSGQCWALTTNCPVPGPVPTSPANRDYKPGFSAQMMLKDLKLSQQAAAETGAATPLGARIAALYERLVVDGAGSKDFSAIFSWLKSGPLDLG